MRQAGWLLLVVLLVLGLSSVALGSAVSIQVADGVPSGPRPTQHPIGSQK
jgi:hypothetical protein